ncbi:MAG: DNA-3-methyladenine glycosylase 2 [Clostridia bacterium]|nr:DNA-3-methyladenine glycosylase 2 [Clostridia bacterium]
MIKKEKDRILIQDEYFDIRSTLYCGQVFRFKEDNGIFKVYSKDKCATITEGVNTEIIGDVDYFYDYFDLSTDYKTQAESIIDKPLIRQGLVKGKGIHILKQDPYETLISFIISANNHIPRIKGIIERLCTALGENKGDYYAFPTPEAMASQSVEFYKNLGAGYRDVYLLDAATKVANKEFDVYSPYSLDTPSAAKELMKIKGVGPKVADCILLFAYGKQDVFPVDTWIKKVYKELTGKEDDQKTIRNYLLSVYGDLSGIAQQYLFYGVRNKD